MVFSDIFYDGFDGCDQGNFTSWKKISGNWSVFNPDSQTCLIENALVGRSDNESFITYANDSWTDYSLDISIKSLPSDSSDSSVSICFGLKDLNSYYQLNIRPIQNTDKAAITVSQKTSTETIYLSEFQTPWPNNSWHQLQIKLNSTTIQLQIDDLNPTKITSKEKEITGGIGLMLKGKMTAYFDNIHIRESKKTQ